MKFKKISTTFGFQISCLALLVSCLLFHVPKTFAANYQMIFWYPGEAGTTEEARNTLDAFFDHVNTKVAPDKITGKYFNSVEGGASFIKQSKPKFGIISFAAYQMNGASLGQNSIIMQTLPLPDGKPVERYVIMGKGAMPKDWSTTTLYSKQPLTTAFVEKYILPFKAKGVQTVNNILPALKDIAAGTKPGGVILQPIEYFTLKNLQQPWVKDLSVWHTSQDIPSAPLVVFGAEDAFAQKFKAVLLNMPNDPEGKAILETLRLKGFKTIQ